MILIYNCFTILLLSLQMMLLHRPRSLTATRMRQTAPLGLALGLHVAAIIALWHPYAAPAVRPAQPLEVAVTLQDAAPAPMDAAPHPPSPHAAPPEPHRVLARLTPTPPQAPAPLPAAPAPAELPPPNPALATTDLAPPAQAVSPPAEPPALRAPRYDAAYLNNPAPNYPPVSRRLGEAGRVILRVYVSAEGVALEVRLGRSSGYPRLDEAALAAVREWRFTPARQGEHAVAAWVSVPLGFDLDS